MKDSTTKVIKTGMEQLRAEICRLVDMVSEAYLDDLRWAVQQYAAKSLNEAVEERKKQQK